MIRVILLASLLWSSLVTAQTSTVSASRYNHDLEQLRPEEPIRYYELAERIADEARLGDDIRLARRLYVLALHISYSDESANADAGFPIAASACLGLADIDTSEVRKQWLFALAGRIDVRYAARRWDKPAGAEDEEQAPMLLSEAVGLTMSGDGSLARDRLDDPRVQSLLESTRDFLNKPGGEASSSGLMREAQIWPCPECGNARSVPDRNQGGRARRLCSTCRGNPGPVIDRETYIAYLAYQSILLDGLHRSWSSELAIGKTRPMLDPEPSEVAPTMNIDPDLVYFRNGNWTASPGPME